MSLALCLLTLFLWAPQAGSLREFAESLQGTRAYELIAFGTKIGWNVERYELVERQGVPALLRETREKVSLGSEDGESRSFVHSRMWYSLEGEGELLELRWSTVEDGKEDRVVVLRDGDGWRARSSSGGAEREWEVPALRDTLAGHRRLASWLAEPRVPGDVQERFTCDFDRDDPNVAERFEYRSAATEVAARGDAGRHVVVMSMDGMDMDAVVDARGVMVSARVGELMQVRQTSLEQAMALGPATIDLFERTTVTLEQAWPDPAALDTVVLEVKGDPGLSFPTSPAQEVSVLGEGHWLIRLRQGRDWGEPAPLSDPERVSFLRSTNRLRCEDPLIQETARRVGGELEDGPVAVSARLQAWIYRNLRGAYDENARNAVQVLEAGGGDCTEHALLFVALARTLGIPAREVSGLLYFDDGEGPCMGWHAWAEVHDGRQWVGVDPAWDEVRLQPTRLKFSEDETDMSWIRAVGSLEVKVREFVPRQP